MYHTNALMFNDKFSDQFEAKELYHGERSVNARHPLYAAINDVRLKKNKKMFINRTSLSLNE